MKGGEKMNENIQEGILLKAVNVEGLEVTDSDLRKINKFTLSPLKAEDIYAFKAYIGDNETDDRNFEPFNLNALKDLQKLYIGKTVLKDHRGSADNQFARIYDTELQTEPKMTKAGEPFTKLIAKCYMVRTESNKDLIAEIAAGIKREVSTASVPKKLICNICGTDNMKTYCPHYAGRDYDKDGKKQTCLMTIDGCKEAYELSFVAVPAQPRAGTTKHYSSEAKPMEQKPEAEKEHSDAIKDFNNRMRLVESFLFVEKENEHE